MKAITYTKYGTPDVLQITDVEKPIPKDNEVLVKIKATTVSAVDSIFRKGDHFFARLATGITKPRNAILGTEFSGEIESIGKNVKLFKIGDRVFGDGGSTGAHTEYLCVPEDESLETIPEKMTYAEAAAIPYGTLTALPFLRDSGKIKSGQKVLIIGASGSVGSFAVQFANYFGADVTGVCSTSNVALVKSIGADKVIDYTEEDFTKTNETYDIIFDTVGKSSFTSCKSSLKNDGIYLTAVIDFSILLQMLWTSKVGTKKAIIAFTGLRPSKEKKEDLIFIKKLIEEGKLKPVIDKTYPFEQTAEAHAYVDKGHKKGNVVINL